MMTVLVVVVEVMVVVVMVVVVRRELEVIIVYAVEEALKITLKITGCLSLSYSSLTLL